MVEIKYWTIGIILKRQLRQPDVRFDHRLDQQVADER